jgi:serine/threonine-protein kinase
MRISAYGCGAVVAGRYHLDHLLGAGGAAVVYRATDLETGDVIALKLARAPTDEMNENLQREAEALARVRHPGIVRVRAHGIAPDGRTYLVLGYLAGDSLRTILRAGVLAPLDALTVTGAVAEAVAALHMSGLLHRDLKPDNIIVPVQDTARRPRDRDSRPTMPRPAFAAATLIDLGICGRLQPDGQTDTGRTRWGRVSGTPWYAAPEQLAGRPQTPATDVFGLGVLLYELLTGRRPQADAPVQVLRAPNGDFVAYTGPFVRRRLTEAITPPITPPLPTPIQDFLMRCLQRDPAARAQRVEDVVDGVHAILVGIQADGGMRNVNVASGAPGSSPGRGPMAGVNTRVSKRASSPANPIARRSVHETPT